MPKIEEYSSRTQAQAVLQRPSANADSFGGGQGLAALGQGIGQAAGALAEYSEKKEIFEAQKLVAKEQVELADYISEQERTAPPGAEGFSQTVAKNVEERRSKILANFSPASTQARQILETSLDDTYSRTSSRAKAFEVDSSARKAVREVDQILDAKKNTLRKSPQELQTLVKSAELMIQDMPFGDEETRAKASTVARQGLYASAIDGTVTRLETSDKVTVGDVDRMIGNMQSEKAGWISNLDSQAYDQNLTRLQKLKETLKAREEQDMFTDFEERMDQIQTTGVETGMYTADWIKCNIADPRKQEAMLKRQDIARAVGMAAKEIQGKPFSVVAQELAALDPRNPTSPAATSKDFYKEKGAYQAKLQAFQKAMDDYQKDPAGYVATISPAVKSSLDVLSENATPEAANQYASMAIAEQKRVDPSAIPSLLNSTQVGSIAAQIKAINSTPNGAPEAVDLLQKQQSLWGKNWPTVVKDLKAAKSINNEQYVAATMMDKPQYRYIAEDLMRASATKTEDLLKMIPDGSEKAAREAVASEMADFRNTITSAGTINSTEVYGAFQEAATKLILYKSAQAGEDMSSEASDIVNKMINEHYEFSDTYRIPRSKDVRAIENGIEATQLKLEQMTFVPPADLAGLKDFDVVEAYKTRTLESGRFVTKGDDSGLRFLDERGREVMVYRDNKEVPLEFTWDDLISAQRDFNDSVMKGFE